MNLLKKLAAVLAGLVLFFVLLCGMFILRTNHMIRTVDKAHSPDMAYELKLQSVGEPFLFGPTKGRLALKHGSKTISKYRFMVANDGAPIHPTTWQVRWRHDWVEVLIDGSEQDPVCIQMGYDGSVKTVSVETTPPPVEILPEIPPQIEDPTIPKDSEMTFGEMDGYYAIYDLFFDEQNKSFIEQYTAKGNSYVILAEDDTHIEYLMYDRESKNGKCGLYVYYICQKAEDGSWSIADSEIQNIYGFCYETGDLYPSGKTSWDQSGTPGYQEATGEN